MSVILSMSGEAAPDSQRLTVCRVTYSRSANSICVSPASLRAFAIFAPICSMVSPFICGGRLRYLPGFRAFCGRLCLRSVRLHETASEATAQAICLCKM